MYPQATAIGTDLGRNAVRTAVVRYNGEILLRKQFPLKDHLTANNILSSLSIALRQTREEATELGINPIAAGISVPGFIDHNNGIVLGPDHGISGWKNVPVASLMNKSVGLPVYAGNDANLMTIAEHRYGRAKGFSHAVFIALRTGIGGGIIIDGKLYRGVSNSGGEIGMMIINAGTGRDNVTGTGTLEYYASGEALVRSYIKCGGSGKGSGEKMKAKDIFELDRKGDRIARKTVAENARIIGIGLANLVSIFAPEIIVLGGGMSLAGKKYVNLIRKHTLANAPSWCSEGLIIETALLGEDASVAGAACYALDRLDGRNI